jgi:lysophospholipid acyltransferase (LPLAT)-like uncharacterized protein
MTPFKRALRSGPAQALLGRLIAGYVHLVRATGRWEAVNQAVLARLWDTNEPAIGAFWHGRMLMIPLLWPRGRPVGILISDHADGRLIARAIGRFGQHAIVGSTTRGGAAAFRMLLRTLAAGVSVAVTPDGPRGPRMRVAGAVIDLARLSGRAIVPVSYACSRRLVMRSWDRFVVPLPFGRGVWIVGEPVRVPRDADAAAVEAARRAVEDRLNAITAEADHRLGAATIEPAPAPARAGA